MHRLSKKEYLCIFGTIGLKKSWELQSRPLRKNISLKEGLLQWVTEDDLLIKKAIW